jgi:hypothetical protein
MTKKKKQGATLEGNTRVKIAEHLPDAIDCAIRSYRNFYQGDAGAAAKEFSAHHSACKAAISHIELLLKLAVWAEIPRDNTDNNLAEFLNSAQEELNKYNAEEDADE